MSIIVAIHHTERYPMQKTVHNARNKNHARRYTTMLMLHRGISISDVVRTLCCARHNNPLQSVLFNVTTVEKFLSLNLDGQPCPGGKHYQEKVERYYKQLFSK